MTISELACNKIKDKMTVSLGGGSNVMNLAREIKKRGLSSVTFCSPSELTISNCKQIGFEVHHLDEIDQIDLAFDGCDSVEHNLNALKSGGGIHLFEKVAAQMSDEYVLLLPKERIQPSLSPDVPLCIEVAEPAVKQVLILCEELGLKTVLRQDTQVAAFARSPQGNLLIDAFTNDWSKIDQINQPISAENGVIATSYFKDLVTSLITMDDSDKAVEIKKGDL